MAQACFVLRDFQSRCGQLEILASDPGRESLGCLASLVTRENPREPRVVRFAAPCALFPLWKGSDLFAHPKSGLVRPYLTRELCSRAASGDSVAPGSNRSICADDRVNDY